jgi:Tol biopolymer transport system component
MSLWWRRLVAPVLACLALAVFLAPLADAQDYFGQNKVRYQAFDFQVLSTEHFDIYYYSETKEVVPEAARMAERWYARISKALQHDLSRRQPLVLYASHPAFEQTNAIYGDLGEGVGGVTEALKRRIVVPFAGPLAETDHVIGHELVHAFQYDIVGQGRSQTMGLMTASRLPLWFMEGMAEYLTLGADDPHTAMWMRDAAQVKKLPNYGRLEDSRYFPYRFGQSLWAYLTGRFGEDVLARVLKAAGRSGDVRQALQGTLGVPADSVIMGWHRALRDWEGPLARRTEPTRKAATPLVLAKRGVGRMNLGPALSPDGRQLVFFSERGQVSIEMYLADAVSGKVLRAITRSTVDLEMQNLGFINSGGEWSPDGKRFAFSTVSRGRPVLAVMEVASGRIVRRVPFADLGEVFRPTWSPDGRRIAFSALGRGVTDLWVLDLESGAARRLTDDDWADLQPAWSPDGKSIAFVTDRFGPAPGGSRYGGYRLALIDPETGAIRALETFATGKSINPQWTPDGRSLCFIGAPDGIANLYRLTLEGGHIEPLTNLLTGVSGLTHLSPALTVARQSGQIVFSAYDAGNFELFRLDEARYSGGIPRDSLPVTLPVTLATARDSLPAAPRAGADSLAAGSGGANDSSWAAPATLPPSPRALAAWVDSSRTAVAAVDTMRFSSARYRPRLSLDYISQPSLGVSAGSSGVGVGGGAGLYWSDMLGDHELVTLLQVTNVGGNVLNNTAAAVAYQDLRSRWNWGLQASQIPYITQGYLQDYDPILGRYTEEEQTFWQIERALMGSVSYPFSRFSRVEFSAGARNISFANRVRRIVYDNAATYTDETLNNLYDNPASLTLAGGGVALVHDSGVFGGTSPVLGQRYRFEVTGLGGSIQYHDVLADYRRYLRLGRSLILAGRALHYGRYGPGAEDSRLLELYLGDPWLIRGYDPTSVSNQLGDQINHADFATGAFVDRLFGSRLAVANLELRVPLLGALGLYPTPSLPPIEAAFFFDAGTAWTRDEKTRILGGPRRPVTSYGVAFRANLFGFAIGEADLVHPNDRPGQGWYWELSLQPGF